MNNELTRRKLFTLVLKGIVGSVLPLFVAEISKPIISKIDFGANPSDKTIIEFKNKLSREFGVKVEFRITSAILMYNVPPINVEQQSQSIVCLYEFLKYINPIFIKSINLEYINISLTKFNGSLDGFVETKDKPYINISTFTPTNDEKQDKYNSMYFADTLYHEIFHIFQLSGHKSKIYSEFKMNFKSLHSNDEERYQKAINQVEEEAYIFALYQILKIFGSYDSYKSDLASNSKINLLKKFELVEKLTEDIEFRKQ